MMKAVRKRASAESTVLGGEVAVPSAVRSSDRTTTIRVNDVTITRMEGASDRMVMRATSCRARSVIPWPWPMLMPKSCAAAGPTKPDSQDPTISVRQQDRSQRASRAPPPCTHGEAQPLPSGPRPNSFAISSSRESNGLRDGDRGWPCGAAGGPSSAGAAGGLATGGGAAAAGGGAARRRAASGGGAGGGGGGATVLTGGGGTATGGGAATGGGREGWRRWRCHRRRSWSRRRWRRRSLQNLAHLSRKAVGSRRHRRSSRGRRRRSGDRRRRRWRRRWRRRRLDRPFRHGRWAIGRRARRRRGLANREPALDAIGQRRPPRRWRRRGD